jgi:hypothetical protein
MARKMSATAIGGRGERRCAPRQMDLFKGTGAKASDGCPVWPDLPEDARNALVGLMTQLMLSHARAASVTATSDDR